jgi:hypothetical protein
VLRSKLSTDARERERQCRIVAAECHSGPYTSTFLVWQRLDCSGGSQGVQISYTYLWSWALLEEPLIVHPLKNFPEFHGTRRLNTVFTRALHWSLSWAISIQSTLSHPVSLRSILDVFALPVVFFLQTFPPVSYMHSSSPHSCYIPRPSYPSWLNHSNYTWRGTDLAIAKCKADLLGGRRGFSLIFAQTWSCTTPALRQRYIKWVINICTEEGWRDRGWRKLHNEELHNLYSHFLPLLLN